MRSDEARVSVFAGESAKSTIGWDVMGEHAGSRTDWLGAHLVGPVDTFRGMQHCTKMPEPNWPRIEAVVLLPLLQC